jgi:hypothetical protein
MPLDLLILCLTIMIMPPFLPLSFSQPLFYLRMLMIHEPSNFPPALSYYISYVKVDSTSLSPTPLTFWTLLQSRLELIHMYTYCIASDLITIPLQPAHICPFAEFYPNLRLTRTGQNLL